MKFQKPGEEDTALACKKALPLHGSNSHVTMVVLDLPTEDYST